MKVTLHIICIALILVSPSQSAECYDFWVRWTSCPPMTQFPHSESACFKSVDKTFVFLNYEADTIVNILCDYKAIEFSDLFTCLGISHVGEISFDNCVFSSHSIRDILGHVSPKTIAIYYNQTIPIGHDLSFDGLRETTTIIIVGARSSREIKIHFEDIPFLHTISLYQTDYTFSTSRLLKLPLLKNFASCEGALNEIPEGFFNESTGLTHINLGYNCLSDLATGIFDGLHTIYTVRLNHNCFISIRAEWFDRMDSLLYLDVSYNRLKSLPDSLFSVARNIEIFNVSSNHQLKLTGDSLQGADNLIEFRADNCSLETFPSDLLKNLSRLTVFSASQNNLSFLPPNLISTQKALNEISLANNRIKFVPSRFFSNQHAINKILLHDNEIESLQSYTFSGLTNLIVLDLHSNKLEALDMLVFSDLRKLLSLDLSRNRLKILSRSSPFGNSEYLKLVNVSHNLLTEFPSIDWDLHDVMEVDCDHNAMASVTLNPYGKKGTRVTLRSNPIANIKITHKSATKEQFAVYFLESSSIICNCDLQDFLSFINTDIGRQTFPNAKRMKCSKPEIWEDLPVTNIFPIHLVCPVELDCPSDCHCFRMPNGNILSNCSNAGITQPPEAVPSGTSILHLENNNITSLSNLSRSWDYITELYLTKNSLRSLKNWTVPSSLQTLAIDGNILHELPPAVMERVDTYPQFKIYLAGNNWQCDCYSVLLKKWFTRNKDKIADYNNTLCTRSSREDNKMITSLIRDVPVDLFCPNPPQILAGQVTAVIISVVIIAILLIGISVTYYQYNSTIMAFLYSHNLYFHCCRQEDEDKIYDAFVCYSSLDRDIAMSIMNELEPSHRLCVHERDWLPGYPISHQIVNSVQNSRKTLLLVSKDFLESIWFQVEFRTAYNQMLEDKVHRLILVLIGEVDGIDGLEADLRLLIATKTYLKWDEKWFWEKLRYSLRGRHSKGSNDLPLEGKGDFCSIDGFVQQTNAISVVS